jgi:mono/diheme cytochrome c family protein
MARKTWMGAALALVGTLALGARAEVDKKTERLWKAKCASCHGADGKAQTDQGKKLLVADYTAAEWQKAKTDEDIKKGIAEGVSRVHQGIKQEMDGYKGQLTPEQIDSLVAYIRSLK